MARGAVGDERRALPLVRAEGGAMTERRDELIELFESLDELPDDQREVAELLIRIDHRVDMATLREMERELNRQDTVGPLLNPGSHDIRKSGKALDRIRAFIDFKARLTEIEERGR